MTWTQMNGQETAGANQRAPSTHNLDSASQAPFRVLLTGFGPFQQVKLNTSHILATRLDGILLTSDPLGPDIGEDGLNSSSTNGDSLTHRHVSISTYIPPVQVCYKEVLDLVPRLHQLPYDLILHVGVGGSEGICLEQRARRFGYVHQDVSGQLAPSEGPTSSATCIRRGYFNPRHGEAPDNLATIVNVEDVVKRVRRAGVLPVKVSDDAGLFLCEFIYYSSLMEAQNPHPARLKSPLVQFVHIPSIDFAEEGFLQAQNEPALTTREPGPFRLDELSVILSGIIWRISLQAASR